MESLNRRHQFANALALSTLLVLIAPLAGAAICGDCDMNGTVTVTDALRAGQMGLAVLPYSLPADATCDADNDGDVDVLDALRIAQFAVGIPGTLACGRLTPFVRAVHSLGTTQGAPTRSAPTPGNPEGDVVGLNEGEFNDRMTLGAGGNPLVFFEPGQTFQVVLEATLESPLRVVDVSAAVNPEGTTIWSSATSAIMVSTGGLVTGVLANECSLLTATFTPLIGAPLSTDFLACVDLHGVDHATRAIWLPEGELDAGLVGMPSGPAAPVVGGMFSQYYSFNAGSGTGFLGLHIAVEWDPTVLTAMSLSGSMPVRAIPSRDPMIAAASIQAFLPLTGTFFGAVTSSNYIPVNGIIEVIGLHWQVTGAGVIAIDASLSSAGHSDGSPYARTYPGFGAAASHDVSAVVTGGVSYFGPMACQTTLCGDVNGDGALTFIDALNLSQYLAGLVVGIQADNTNVAGDQSPSATCIVDIVDQAFIVLAGVGIITLDCCP